MGSKSRWATFVVGLLAGSLFLWLAIRDVDVETVAKALGTAQFSLTVPLLLTLALFYWLKAQRWAYLLSPVGEFSDKQLFAPMIIGFAGNNVLPVRLGELLRAYLLGREFRISKTLVFATLVLERVFDAVCILALITVTLLGSNIVSTDLSAARYTLTTITLLAVALAFAIAHPPAWLCRLAETARSVLPMRLNRTVGAKATEIRQGFAAINSVHKITKIIVNSTVQWILLALCVQLAIMAFDVQVSLAAPVIVLGLLVVGISLPGAPGFIGTIEICFVVGLALFGVDASQALAIAIFYHVLTFAFVTVLGAVFLPRYRKVFANPRHDDLLSRTVDH